ncbi:MAG TPA: hypothetical protein VMT27_07660 [Actinomycetes bacterium]|nr:hypothetical protein [Actinomycetes bacterium]
MARYGDEYIQTIRERMRNDIMATIAARDVNVGYADDPDDLTDLIDALVEDGMHPLEKIIADVRHEDLILGRYQ